MRWSRRALFGCAALKSAYPISRQTVSAEVAEERARSGLVWVFLDRSAVEVHDERARVVRLEPDHLVGPAVELEVQNAIDLVRDRPPAKAAAPPRIASLQGGRSSPHKKINGGR